MRIFPSLRAFLFALVMLLVPAAAFAQIGITVAFGPPELPVYDQPVCPGDGYIWTPGYWAYGDDDYYWVPGTWVEAPEVGFLWTPPYWGWGGSGFVFYDGYWGPQVGFYGGIDYGFGYFGHGYEGGRWDHDHFFYNRSVNNVDVSVVRNVYNTRVEDTRSSRVSFNGGNGGINDRPRPEEEAAARQRHVPPVAAQSQHVQAARSNPQLRSSANHGNPPVAATPRPGAFSDRGSVAARQGGRTNNPSANQPARTESGASRSNNAPARSDSGASRSNNPGHVKDLPPIERSAPPNTGNAKTDQKYQQQQQKLSTRQDQERQKLQQKQEQDHQRMAQQNANDTRKQQVEQQHQQQTQQLVQKHTQQQQQLQQRQQPSRPSQSKQKP